MHMSELIPPTFLTIPGDLPQYEHTTDAGMATALLRFATSSRPVEVFRNVAPVADEAIARLMPLLPEPISFDTIDGIYDVTSFNYNPGDHGLGLHIDFIHPPSNGSDLLQINFHHTSQGSARARFLRINTERIMEWYATGPNYRDIMELLPADIIETFTRYGLVDPYYLDTEGIEVTVDPGDIVLFKEALPLAHEFTTLNGEPRSSAAIIGSIVITPLLRLPGFRY